jgi:hypothetical protein
MKRGAFIAPPGGAGLAIDGARAAAGDAAGWLQTYVARCLKRFGSYQELATSWQSFQGSDR